MLFPNGKEYYPLGIRQIISQNGDVLYDRDKRNKPYVYIAIENTEEKEKK